VAGPELALLYPRVSSRKQAEEGYSLAEQEKRQKAYCKKKGYVVAGVFAEDFTGTAASRPQLDRILATLRAGRGAVVVATDLDRLSRMGPGDTFFLERLIQQAGGRVEFTEVQYTNDNRGQLMKAVDSFKAADEAESIFKRTQRGKREKIGAGKMPGYGTTPYGYRRVRDAKGHCTGYAEDEATAWIVRWIYQLYLAGESLNRIALLLDARAIPTPSGGKRWGTTTVRWILRSPIYGGQPIADRYHWERRPVRERATGQVVEKVVRVERPEGWTVLPATAAPALVSAADWEVAQRRLADNRAHFRGQPRNRDLHLLRGLVTCAHCDKPVYAVWIGDKPVYRCKAGSYRASGCPHRLSLPQAELDAAVWPVAIGWLSRPGLLEARARAALEAADNGQAEAAAARAALADLDAQIGGLTAKFALLDGPAAELIAQHLNKLAADRLNQLEKLRRAEGQAGEVEAALTNLRALTAGWPAGEAAIRAKLEALDVAARREALALIGFEVQAGMPGHFGVAGSGPVDGRWRLGLAMTPPAYPASFSHSSESERQHSAGRVFAALDGGDLAAD
jgi:site-specific DNA recombinase